MCVGLCVPLLVVFHGVHWWHMCRIQDLQDLPDAGSGPLVVCSLLFWGLSRLACLGLLENMPLFRILRAFLEGFMGFVWVCVVLALCLACVAFVRVWS